MKKIESDYFTLYKKVERILINRYQSQKGVSYLIAELETYNKESRLTLEDYHFLKDLKRCRYLRNQIAHDQQVSITADDYQLLKNIYKTVSKNKEPKIYETKHVPIYIITIQIVFVILFMIWIILKAIK